MLPLPLVSPFPFQTNSPLLGLVQAKINALSSFPLLPPLSPNPLQTMYDALSPLQQYMFQQLTVLHGSTGSTGDKAAAISGLGERQEPWMRKSHPQHAQREIYRPAMVVYC